MSLEPCPYCGKLFKRVKSHLPHCKMLPTPKPTKTKDILKELPTTTPKHTIHTDKNKVPKADKKLNYKSPPAQLKPQTKSKMKTKEVTDEFFQSDSFKLPATGDKIPSAEGKSTEVSVKPKSKWLAKREKELIKQGALLKQNGTKFNSDTQQKKHDSLCEATNSQGPQQLERNINKGCEGTALTTRGTLNKINNSDILQRPSLIAGFQAEQSIPKPKSSANVIQQTLSIPETLSGKLTLVAGVNDKADLSLFQTKTCVWDHIKEGLYVRRSASVYLSHMTELSSAKSEHTFTSLTEWPFTKNNQYAVMKAPTVSLLPFCQTSVQRLTSKMATGHGGTHPSSLTEVLSTENVKNEKCQSFNPLPQSQGPVAAAQRLGDVRLGELVAWLGARTPRTPMEVVTMLNKGWLWYYRKYIDVQKGGIGGISMLIAGYCVLSYIWSYPHLKRERWRKYH